MFELTPEGAEDWWEVEALYDLCFGPARTALSSYRLRERVEPVAGLSLVARDPDGLVGGAIRYWSVRIVAGAGRVHPALLLGPVAVHPTHQGEGLGGVLIRDSLDIAARHGWPRVMLVGDAPYYARFGFGRLGGVKMPPPTNPERVLGRALVPGAWDGISGQVMRET